MNLKLIATETILAVSEELKGKALSTSRGSAKEVTKKAIVTQLSAVVLDKTGLASKVHDRRYNSRVNGEISLSIDIPEVVFFNFEFLASFEVRKGEGNRKEFFLKSLKVDELYSKDVYQQDLTGKIELAKAQATAEQEAARVAKAAETAALAAGYEGAKETTIRVLEEAISQIRKDEKLDYRFLSDEIYRLVRRYETKFS